jgi:hypothetical protein
MVINVYFNKCVAKFFCVASHIQLIFGHLFSNTMLAKKASVARSHIVMIPGKCNIQVSHNDSRENNSTVSHDVSR